MLFYLQYASGAPLVVSVRDKRATWPTYSEIKIAEAEKTNSSMSEY